jgi:hypothetical protein
VVSSLTSEAILGLDFLRVHDAIVDVKKSEICTGNKNVALHLGPQSCVNGDAISKVCPSTSLTLPPHSEQVVMAECEGQPRSGPCIVEPGGGERLPFAVARALVEPRDGRVPVRLLNPGSEAVSLHSGSVVAALDSVEAPSGNVVAGVSMQPPTVDTDKTELLWELVEQSGTEVGPEERERAMFCTTTRECRYFCSVEV